MVYVKSISAVNGSVISFVVIQTALFMTSNYYATVSEMFIGMHTHIELSPIFLSNVI